MAEITYEINKDLRRIDINGQPHAWQLLGQLIFKYLTDADRRLLGFPPAERQKYAELETYHFVEFSEAIPYDCDKETVVIERAEKRKKMFSDRLNTTHSVTNSMKVQGDIKDKYTVMEDLEKELDNG